MHYCVGKFVPVMQIAARGYGTVPYRTGTVLKYHVCARRSTINSHSHTLNTSTFDSQKTNPSDWYLVLYCEEYYVK